MTHDLLHGGVAHNTNDAEQSWILAFHSIFGVRRDSHKGIKAIDKVCQLLAGVLPEPPRGRLPPGFCRVS